MAIGAYISAVDALQKAIDDTDITSLERTFTICDAALYAKQKLVFFGNGGSAAIAQHLAAELIGRFKRKKRAPLPAISLASDATILTALGNDFGMDYVFEGQVLGLVNGGDVAIGFSTSGKSPNVIRGLTAAAKLGARTVLFTGQNAAIPPLYPDDTIVISVPSYDTARIQEAHLFFGHLLCESLDYDR